MKLKKKMLKKNRSEGEWGEEVMKKKKKKYATNDVSSQNTDKHQRFHLLL